MAKPEKEVEIGDKFGEYTVIEVGLWAPSGKRKMRAALLQCSCGSLSTTRLTDLTKRKRCCKCNPGPVTHGHAPKGNWSPEYATWQHLLGRCRNPNNNRFVSHGERGITVCEEWKESFETFLKDMGPRPTPEHSIDRVDNDGGYSPGNCRWATPSQQARNKRNIQLVEYLGESKPLIAWAEQFNLDLRLVWNRMHKLKWSVEKSLTTPIRGAAKAGH